MAESVGRWSDPFELSNVAVHATLLPNGKVLYWGRRENPKSTDLATLDEHFTKAFVWDPATRTSIPTANEPLGIDGHPVNLFCAGHSLLPDGTILITGGHVKDGWGVNQACVYNPTTNTFTPKVPHNKGRWYPSVLTLPDGRALVISGSYDQSFTVNNIPEIWPSDTGSANPTAWIEVADPLNQQGLVFPLYPRMHVAPNGRIIVVGPLADSFWLDVKDPVTGIDIQTPVAGGAVVGRWSSAGTSRKAMFRDYCPSVMYDTGKIMYIGGGLTVESDPGPTNEVEFLDLNVGTPKWTGSAATNMKVPRRQFNATVLPDGSVLVTGGTKGPGFNDLSQPVHLSELWDPTTGRWTDMASESVNRCYHGTALLLPDGKVLSAGGGEYGGAGPDQCFTNAQLFEPPYLHKGRSRPTITAAPSEIAYGKDFSVTLGSSDTISKISWVRLGSVTHCRNMNQSLMFLTGFRQTGTNLTVPAPANTNLSPPGHYMLFALDPSGVPSVAQIIHISSSVSPRLEETPAIPSPCEPPATEIPLCCSSDKPPTAPDVTPPPPSLQPTLTSHTHSITNSHNCPPIVVGLTPSCPYGLGPCFAGAYDALRKIPDIEIVCPVPNQAESVAYVYTKDAQLLPRIGVWKDEFAKVVNKSYEMLGIEVVLEGVIEFGLGSIGLSIKKCGGSVLVDLKPFGKERQIRWDWEEGVLKEVKEEEENAAMWLREEVEEKGVARNVKVTGTLESGEDGNVLYVREFEMMGGDDSA